MRYRMISQRTHLLINLHCYYNSCIYQMISVNVTALDLTVIFRNISPFSDNKTVFKFTKLLFQLISCYLSHDILQKKFICTKSSFLNKRKWTHQMQFRLYSLHCRCAKEPLLNMVKQFLCPSCQVVVHYCKENRFCTTGIPLLF